MSSSCYPKRRAGLASPEVAAVRFKQARAEQGRPWLLATIGHDPRLSSVRLLSAFSLRAGEKLELLRQGKRDTLGDPAHRSGRGGLRGPRLRARRRGRALRPRAFGWFGPSLRPYRGSPGLRGGGHQARLHRRRLHGRHRSPALRRGARPRGYRRTIRGLSRRQSLRPRAPALRRLSRRGTLHRVSPRPRGRSRSLRTPHTRDGRLRGPSVETASPHRGRRLRDRYGRVLRPPRGLRARPSRRASPHRRRRDESRASRGRLSLRLSRRGGDGPLRSRARLFEPFRRHQQGYRYRQDQKLHRVPPRAQALGHPLRRRGPVVHGVLETLRCGCQGQGLGPRVHRGIKSPGSGATHRSRTRLCEAGLSSSRRVHGHGRPARR